MVDSIHTLDSYIGVNLSPRAISTSVRRTLMTRLRKSTSQSNLGYDNTRISTGVRPIAESCSNSLGSKTNDRPRNDKGCMTKKYEGPAFSRPFNCS